jgi:hypothetical protein
LRYETICATPIDSARATFALCGIPCDDRLLERIIAQVGVPTASGVRAWTRLERALYGAGAGELLRELGYAPPPAPGVRLLRLGLRGYEKVKAVL